MKKLLIALLTAILLITNHAYADGTLADADKFYSEKNYAQAIKIFKEFALKGNPNAQYLLGVMYYNGQGVPQDFTQVLKWWQLSAEQGNTSAQYLLGVMYVMGQGVQQDYVLAHVWLNLAAAQGYKEAEILREEIAINMTPQQISQAQKLASKCKAKNYKNCY